MTWRGGKWAPVLHRPDLGCEEERCIGVLVVADNGEWLVAFDEEAIAWLRRDYDRNPSHFAAAWQRHIREDIAALGPERLLGRPGGHSWGYQTRLGEGRSTRIDDAAGVGVEARWLLDRVARPPEPVRRQLREAGLVRVDSEEGQGR